VLFYGLRTRKQTRETVLISSCSPPSSLLRKTDSGSHNIYKVGGDRKSKKGEMRGGELLLEKWIGHVKRKLYF
jgi:hypothetical protein